MMVYIPPQHIEDVNRRNKKKWRGIVIGPLAVVAVVGTRRTGWNFNYLRNLCHKKKRSWWMISEL